MFLIVRTSKPLDERFQAKRLAAAGVLGIYWHFMDILWIYLFLLLFALAVIVGGRPSWAPGRIPKGVRGGTPLLKRR